MRLHTSAIALLASAAMTATADAQLNLSSTVLSITADNGSSSSTISFNIGDGAFSPDNSVYILQQTSAVSIGGIASLDAATLIVRQGLITLNFAVSSGADDVTFEIVSPELSFFDINESVAEASASIGLSVTDVDGGTADVFGALPNGGVYNAAFNVGDPDQFDFAELGNDASAGALSSTGINDRAPAAGQTPTGATVRSMQASLLFDLSEQDRFSGTTVFAVTPAPGAAAMMLIGSLGLTRRRR